MMYVLDDGEWIWLQRFCNKKVDGLDVGMSKRHFEYVVDGPYTTIQDADKAKQRYIRTNYPKYVKGVR